MSSNLKVNRILPSSGSTIGISTDGSLVGIGTVTPDRNLHVYSTNASVALFESNNANTISQIIFQGHGAATNPNIGATGQDLHITVGSYDRVRIKPNGDIGIGTVTPSGSVDIVKATASHYTTIRNTDTNSSYTGVQLATPTLSCQIWNQGPNASGYGGANSMNFYQGSNSGNTGSFAFHHGNDERMRIDTSGRVLIGTTTEGQTQADDLTISTSGATGMTIRSGTSSNGSIFFSDGTSGLDEYRGYVQYTHNDGSSSDYLTFGTNASERLRINSTGQMGLGTGASIQTSAKLQVVGNVAATRFYTTTTSSPQTDFTSSVSTNKAGLLLHRLSETNGDYGGLEFHGHPSSITSYRKGGIYWQTDGSGFGRGDMVFVNDGVGDANNLQITDEKMRIHKEGYITNSSQPMYSGVGYAGDGSQIQSGLRAIRPSSVYANIGSHFNTTTGVFTCPIAGRYLCIGGMGRRSSAYTWSGFYLVQNGVTKQDQWFPPAINNTSNYSLPAAFRGDQFTYAPINISSILTCAANDTIYFGWHDSYTSPIDGSGVFAQFILVG